MSIPQRQRRAVANERRSQSVRTSEILKLLPARTKLRRLKLGALPHVHTNSVGLALRACDNILHTTIHRILKIKQVHLSDLSKTSMHV
jgi:hypothetical protein